MPTIMSIKKVDKTIEGRYNLVLQHLYAKLNKSSGPHFTRIQSSFLDPTRPHYALFM